MKYLDLLNMIDKLSKEEFKKTILSNDDRNKLLEIKIITDDNIYNHKYINTNNWCKTQDRKVKLEKILDKI
jgi:hypothetical protein